MSGEDEPKYLHFEERQRLKARSRQNDEDRLARGDGLEQGGRTYGPT